VPTVITYQNGATVCACFWNLLDVTRLNRSAYRQLLKQTESAILGVIVLWKPRKNVSNSRQRAQNCNIRRCSQHGAILSVCETTKRSAVLSKHEAERWLAALTQWMAGWQRWPTSRHNTSVSPALSLPPRAASEAPTRWSCAPRRSDGWDRASAAATVVGRSTPCRAERTSADERPANGSDASRRHSGSSGRRSASYTARTSSSGRRCGRRAPSNRRRTTIGRRRP